MNFSLDVARRKTIDPVFAGRALIIVCQARRALLHAFVGHVVEQAAGILGREVGLERPRRIDVAERRHEVRHV